MVWDSKPVAFSNDLAFAEAAPQWAPLSVVGRLLNAQRRRFVRLGTYAVDEVKDLVGLARVGLIGPGCRGSACPRSAPSAAQRDRDVSAKFAEIGMDASGCGQPDHCPELRDNVRE